jgi:hypothetical protein
MLISSKIIWDACFTHIRSIMVVSRRFSLTSQSVQVPSDWRISQETGSGRYCQVRYISSGQSRETFTGGTSTTSEVPPSSTCLEWVRKVTPPDEEPKIIVLSPFVLHYIDETLRLVPSWRLESNGLTLYRVTPDPPPVEFPLTLFAPADLDFSLTNFPPASCEVVLTCKHWKEWWELWQRCRERLTGRANTRQEKHFTIRKVKLFRCFKGLWKTRRGF